MTIYLVDFLATFLLEMHWMKYLLCLLLTLYSFSLSGQNTVGVNFQGFLPTGELKKDAPEIGGFGFGMEGAFSVKKSPFHVGGIMEWNHFGSEVREGFHGPGYEDVRVRRNYEHIKILGLFRFKPDCGDNIFPYFDVFLGPGNVYTRTQVRDSFLDEPFEAYLDLDEWAFMYGFGFGNEFFLSEMVILDVFFRTVKTTRIEYLSPNGVTFNTNNNWYDFEVRSSAFNHINFGFGIKVYLNQFMEIYQEALFP